MYGLDKFVWKIVDKGGKVLLSIIVESTWELIKENFNN
jgi:hypothetical protein